MSVVCRDASSQTCGFAGLAVNLNRPSSVSSITLRMQELLLRTLLTDRHRGSCVTVHAVGCHPDATNTSWKDLASDAALT